jgi:hypothetical protein
MTRKKSIILWCGIVVILLMTIFPPIIKTVPTEDDDSSYHRVVKHEYYFSKTHKKIYLERLFIEWFIAAVITGGFLYTCQKHAEASQN